MTTTLRSILALIVTAFFAATASAAHVHLKSDPVITDLGEQCQVDLALAGLGNKDIIVTVAVKGSASVIGLNPAGQYVPGQNKVPVSASASATIPKSAIKNGNVSLSLTTPLVEPPDATDVGFPNDLWIVEIDDIEFTEVTITVEQGGKIVLQTTITL
jgi:hypothetical protein